MHHKLASLCLITVLTAFVQLKIPRTRSNYSNTQMAYFVSYSIEHVFFTFNLTEQKSHMGEIKIKRIASQDSGCSSFLPSITFISMRLGARGVSMTNIVL